MNPLIPGLADGLGMILGSLAVLGAIAAIVWWSIHGITRNSRNRR